MTLKAVIIAGGKGTRLQGAIGGEIPKPMARIGGVPVLEHQIELLKRYGCVEVFLLTGFLSEVIEEYFGDGSRFGVKVAYYREPHPLGTAGCIKLVEEAAGENIIVFNGDQVMDFNITRMVDFHRRKEAAATLFLHPNDHPYDSDCIELDDESLVRGIYPKPHPEGIFFRNLVNAGAYLFHRRIFGYLARGEKADLGKDLIPRLLAAGEKVAGYVSAEYIKDMGTPDRLEKVERDISSGRVRSSNISFQRPAIFLDRDGVINREINLLSNIDDFALLPDVAHPIRRINSAGYLCVVITNQPVIARNLVSFEQLRAIHNKMEWLLGRERCYLDAIYFCPHHPHSGYPEERRDFKIECDCRKPAPGLIFKAAEDFNIDLEQSYIIGDRESDIGAGKNAGIRTVLVKTNGTHWDAETTAADIRADNLRSAVDLILGGSDNGHNES